MTNSRDERLYAIWYQMMRRCYNAKQIGYRRYGGRGIKVCSEWLIFENFQAWAYGNGYKWWLSIDRIDNDKNYSPDNCQWLTRSDNTRKRSRFFDARKVKRSKKGKILLWPWKLPKKKMHKCDTDFKNEKSFARVKWLNKEIFYRKCELLIMREKITNYKSQCNGNL